MKRWKLFFLRWGTRQGYPLSFTIALEVLSKQLDKKKKKSSNCKRKSKTITTCRWHDFRYRKLKRFHQKIFEIMNNFSSFTTENQFTKTCQISIQLITNYLKMKFFKIPFKIISKWIRYLEINLTKEVKGWYSENYAKMKNEIEDDTNKWKDILCL